MKGVATEKEKRVGGYFCGLLALLKFSNLCNVYSPHTNFVFGTRKIMTMLSWSLTTKTFLLIVLSSAELKFPITHNVTHISNKTFKASNIDIFLWGLL